MTAMNWLAKQLAWEQRLVELRSDEGPTKLRARTQSGEATASRQAA
jgi:hypothetical protein